MEAWWGHSSLCAFKRGATGTEVPFHRRFRSREIFGVAKDFCPTFPKLSGKVFCATFTYKFSPTKIMKTFFGVTSKRGLHVIFCKPWAPFSRGFSGMFPRFSENQNFWGCAWAPPPTSTTVFHNSTIGNFVVYQDRIETQSLQLSEYPENSEWFSIISVIIFEVNIVDEQKQTLLVTIFLFFISFHCPKMFYCPPCRTAAPAPLNMHVVSTNFAKTLVANLNMT